MRSLYSLIAWFAALSACTPEAVEVEPSGGSAGEDASVEPVAGTNSGGGMPNGGKGGAPPGDSCAPISSPKQSCTDCISRECPTEATACEGNACTCGDYRGQLGQMNCLLGCSTLSPKMSAADACARECGFGSLGNSDRTTHQLFDCLVNPPSGPPVCPDCFPFH